MSVLRQAINKYKQDGILALANSSLRFIYWKSRRAILEPVEFVLWKLGLRDIGDMYGEGYYNKMVRSEAQEDAQRFIEIVIKQYDPSFVMDLGCGVGRFLKPLSDSGIEVYGIDGSQYAVENPIDPSIDIDQHDLTEPLEIGREADVVFCLEVLEHLPKEAAQTAVNSISNAAPIAIITAAPPGQGGKHHVNEQSLEYWIDKFENAGMRFSASETELLKDSVSPSELKWLQNNVAVFRREDPDN